MKNQPSKKAEPREFMAPEAALVPIKDGDVEDAEAYVRNHLSENHIRVVEHSAYQALQEKLKVAIEAMTRFCDIEGYRVSAQSGHYIGQALAKIEGHK